MRVKEKEKKKNHSSVFSFGFPCNPLADANLKRGAAIKRVRHRFEIDIFHLTAGVGKRQQSRHSWRLSGLSQLLTSIPGELERLLAA